ncbi:dentin sialophosphoprotein-like [Macrosteles quadrilineatus]|uniref:dentin sialophosphoprotein-like n=1 Tax=Macrosteles quadrilineatus TaxID=74068 RepID=UPI0023E1E69E|nr:dentin sialophosphoprotein-like [Macrosteles quadrilineatus]
MNDNLLKNNDGSAYTDKERYSFRNFYFETGRWQIKNSVYPYPSVSDITGIVEISNISDDIWFSTKSDMKDINKHNKTEKLCSSQEKNGPSSPKKGANSPKETSHPGRSNFGLSPHKTKTKFKFKNPSPEFNPSQDIFNYKSVNVENQFSPMVKNSSNAASTGSPDTISKTNKTTTKKRKKKKHKKRLESSKYTKVNKSERLKSPQEIQKLKDIVAMNLSTLEEFGTSDSEETVTVANSTNNNLTINTLNRPSQELISRSSVSKHSINLENDSTKQVLPESIKGIPVTSASQEKDQTKKQLCGEIKDLSTSLDKDSFDRKLSQAQCQETPVSSGSTLMAGKSLWSIDKTPEKGTSSPKKKNQKQCNVKKRKASDIEENTSTKEDKETIEISFSPMKRKRHSESESENCKGLVLNHVFKNFHRKTISTDKNDEAKISSPRKRKKSNKEKELSYKNIEVKISCDANDSEGKNQCEKSNIEKDRNKNIPEKSVDDNSDIECSTTGTPKLNCHTLFVCRPTKKSTNVELDSDSEDNTKDSKRDRYSSDRSHSSFCDEIDEVFKNYKPSPEKTVTPTKKLSLSDNKSKTVTESEKNTFDTREPMATDANNLDHSSVLTSGSNCSDSQEQAGIISSQIIQKIPNKRVADNSDIELSSSLGTPESSDHTCVCSPIKKSSNDQTVELDTYTEDNTKDSKRDRYSSDRSRSSICEEIGDVFENYKPSPKKTVTPTKRLSLSVNKLKKVTDSENNTFDIRKPMAPDTNDLNNSSVLTSRSNCSDSKEKASIIPSQNTQRIPKKGVADNSDTELSSSLGSPEPSDRNHCSPIKKCSNDKTVELDTYSEDNTKDSKRDRYSSESPNSTKDVETPTKISSPTVVPSTSTNTDNNGSTSRKQESFSTLQKSIEIIDDSRFDSDLSSDFFLTPKKNPKKNKIPPHLRAKNNSETSFTSSKEVSTKKKKSFFVKVLKRKGGKTNQQKKLVSEELGNRDSSYVEDSFSDCTNSSILDQIQASMISSSNELERLKDLNITIDWELSPLHRIDTGSCKVSMAKLRDELGPGHEKHLTDKKFSEMDEDKIKQAWEEFSETYDFSNPELFFPTAQNFGVFPNRERRKFKLFIAKYLPDRHLLSVFSKFTRIYSVKKTGRWSDKEDRLLLDIYHACMEKSTSLDSPNESKREKTLGLPMKKIMMKALNRTLSSVDARLKILLEDKHARNLSQSPFLNPSYWLPF